MNKVILFLCFSIPLFGQLDSTSRTAVQISGYAEGYYLVDPVNKAAHERGSIFFNHGRANQLDLNLGILGVSWTKGPLSAQISGMLGTYSRRNLASESSFWRNIFELNISYQLAKNWGITAGIFPSHIGFESAKNADNWTLSRSFVAENSPYYGSGIRMFFKPNTSWTYSLFVLRGWQHIQDLNPALGTQITYVAANSWTWNSSGFMGNEGNGLRVFHDFYLVVPLSKKVKMVLISDMGFQNEFWHGEALMVQAKLSNKWKLAGRLEQFSDSKAIVLTQGSFIQSASINADFSPFPKMIFRSEWKIYHSSSGVSNLHSPEYMFGVVLGK
ncbi:outer membrane beta-barrel protein [Aquirufa beregesia]